MKVKLTSPQIIALGFAGLILIGTILLTLPITHTNGEWLPFTDALFTATSATCVTGLIVVDTGLYFNLLGQLILIGLIQIGGLGIVTVAAFFLVGLRRHLQFSQRSVLTESLNLDYTGGVVRLLLSVIKLTFLIEGIGAVLLTLTWAPDLGWAKAAYFGIWHSISAFCNAGFDLFGGFQSLTGYAENVGVNLVIGSLIVLGGLGFPIIMDIWSCLRHKHEHLTLHSWVVVWATVVLLLFGAVAFFLFEYNGVLAELSPLGKVLASYFQSVTPRTAGFNTVDMSALNSGTMLLLTLLMFVGASPISTGGGIKTTALACLIFTTYSVVQGNEEIRIGNRSVDKSVVLRALTLTVMAMILVYTITMVISMIEPFAYERILFEVASGLATVGLTTGITTMLGVPSRLLLIMMMYIGRIGPLTLMLALAGRHRHTVTRVPEGRIYIG